MKKYLFGNWKMYLTIAQSLELANKLGDVSFDSKKITGAIFPNTLVFRDVAETLKDSSWNVGAQNVAWTPAGAYTGATSSVLFAEAGATYALVGHSERRHVFGEKNADIRKRFESCLDTGITPVLCIGETQEDRDNGKTQYRIKKQLVDVLDGLDIAGKDFLIAYEPVWAIGTGTPCLPADADDVIMWIKGELYELSFKNVPVLYGGSIDEKNVVSYLTLERIDGVLVGSASTKLSVWQDMLRLASE